MKIDQRPVRKKRVAEELLAGLTELAETLETGGDVAAHFNCYQMRLDLRPEAYTPEMIKKTRRQLRASQTVFAKFLGVSAKAVREWEQGVTVPRAIACRFMDEIRRNPGYYVGRLRESVVPKTAKRK